MSNTEQTGDIAVIGLAGRFPKAKNIELFWQNLRNGVEAISFFSDEELREAGVRVPKGDPNYVKARAVLEEADKFDAEFFGINPKEAEIMDPQHRLFLECAWEALEDAGYAGKRDDRLVGVYAGMSMNTYLLSNIYSRPDVVDLVGGYQIMLGNDKDYLPTRVSYKLNLRGPSINVQTACSTSLVAVCVACEQLIDCQCDMALAGGVSVTFPQKRGYLYQEGGIGSPDGHCRAFDAKAQGTVAGDGVGIVLLKRLPEALQDGDHIYAVIKGFATNNDGSLKAGFTAPSPDGQAEVIALAQAVAGIEPESIGYVVAHGTGTPLGDPIEIEGLTKAFRAGTEARQFCALTSVKTNIGHLDAAAGVAGLINAILAVHHRQIPPSLHYQASNPKIDFTSSPFFVNRHLREWTSEKVRRAAVSAFGIGGTNAHVILEEAPKAEASAVGENAHLLLVSARNKAALDRATERVAAHLETATVPQLADVAYTLALGRAEFEQRRAILCREGADAVTALRTLDPNRVFTATAQTRPSVVFMFPGQGAQHVNMGLELYRTQRIFREQIDGCAETLKSHLDFDLRDVMYPRRGKAEEATQRLTQTAVAQPALFAIEYALAKLWMSWGIAPESLIGHSIGEYVAACLAGVFPLKDALALVALRGSLMQRLPKGTMLAVRLSEAEVTRCCSADVSVAAINSPGNSVLSGPIAAIDALAEQFRKEGIAAQRLHTSHAFHSAMMDPIRSAFAQAVQRIHLRAPRIPYISNLTGSWITAEQAISPGYWSDHLRQSVRFSDGLAELFKKGDLFLLECGPGRTLSTFVRQHPARQATQSTAASLPQAKKDEAADFWAILHAAGQLWTAGVPLDWQAFYGDERRRRVSLPTYPFEPKRHWVEPGRVCETTASELVAVTCPPAETPTTAVEGSDAMMPAPGPVGRELVAASLKSLFSQLSGLGVASIDSRTSFTELGFDSLFLTQVSQAIEKQFKAKVPFGQLLERFSTLELLANHLCGCAAGVEDSPAQPFAADCRVDVTTPGAVRQSPAPEANRAPLTEAQKEIWYAAQHSDQASCVFNESNMLYLKGVLDTDLLRKSIQQVVDRHESLRTTFSPDGDVQEVQPVWRIEVPLIDLSGDRESEQQARMEEMLREDARQPFDLARGPLLRCRLARFHPQFHVLLFTVHHLVCDGASLGIILNEMSEIYSGERRGMPCELPPALRYVDYARKQASLLQSPEKQRAEHYWLDQFKTVPPALELPLDFPRPAEATFSGGWEFRPLKTHLCRELSKISARQKCTLFQTFLAAYYVLLHRLTGQEEIVVGVPTAERSDEGNEKLVGHCVNFLPLRSRLQRGTRFVDYLADLRSSFLSAFEHQNYTFGTLLQKLQLPRDRSRTPLISATFNMVWVRCGLNFPALEVELKPNPVSFSNFDLTFNITETDGAFALDCSFKSDLLTNATVNRWMACFETLLEGIAANPEECISRLSLVPEAERDQLLNVWNNTEADFPRNALVHELIEGQARRTPQALAIVAGSDTLTYSQLLDSANQLAAQLCQLDLAPDALVAICLPVCSCMLVAILAVLKAGGAFVSLQGPPSGPWNRALLRRAAVVIGDLDADSQFSDLPGRFLALDRRVHGIASPAPAFSTSRISAQNLALVVPSGTATDLHLSGFSHRALVNAIFWLVKNLALGENASTLQLKRPASERFAHEIFATWCSGGRLILPEAEISGSLSDPSELITRAKPDRVFLSEGQLSALARSLANRTDTTQSLREIVVHAGKPPLSSELKQLKDKLPHCAFLVLYGSGETGVATAFRINGITPNGRRTPIGRPINNVQVFIFDSELNPVPAGVPGRLFVGGESLAREFVSDPQRTSRRFVRNPIANTRVNRLIETGDIARYLTDGNIELIRAGETNTEFEDWTIDLATLQQTLSQQRGVREAALVFLENPAEGRTLVAYVVAETNRRPAEEDLLELLRAQLPSEAGSAVVFIDKLPRTNTGKTDYSKLPLPRQPLPERPQDTAPRSTTEKVLAGIWCEVVGLDHVGVHDNFFDLGGHSVLVSQLVARIRKAFGVDPGLRSIFERPTIAEAAETIETLLLEEIGSMSEEEAQRLSAESGPLAAKSK